MPLRPQEGPQLDAYQARWCPIIFYGGAKYGGKTYLQFLDYLQDVETYGKHWQGIFVRKSYPDLEDAIAKSHAVFGQTNAIYREGKRLWEWPNGARFRFRALERNSDIDKYQGHSYGYISLDELTLWPTEKIFREFALANNRWGDANIPVMRIRLTGNPGGVGHLWVQNLFINPHPKGYKLFYPEKCKREAMFIPARPEDNRLGLLNDPGYLENLESLGSPELVRMWKQGDWNIRVGSFFPEFGIDHIIEPFTLPSHWHRVRAYDHGYASPFAVLHGAISSGHTDDGKESPIPRGAMVVYREWYGSSGGNNGLRIDPREIAAGIRAREDEEIHDSVADPAIFKTEGGPSIAEELYTHGVKFRRADNQRLPGWLQVRLRLKAKPLPMLYVFSTCTNLIEQLPLQQHSDKHPEDLDTEGEDHLADTLRYLCMSRPMATNYKEPEPVRQFNEIPLAELIAADRRSNTKRL